jgi:hypothetical protein
MRVSVPLGDHGFILRREVSFDLVPGKLANIEGILVDIKGPINPKLKEIQFGNGYIRVVTSLKTVTIQLPEKARFFMKRWFNLAVQIVGTAGQVFNVVGGLIPPQYQLVVATVLGAFQAVVGVVSHNYNPDGTPASVAYQK